jgi:hypothetical protein
VLVVFTVGNLDITKNKYASDGLPSKALIGIGYNKQLSSLGERLDMLDFFVWMKVFQDQGLVNDWVIWDAAAYAIVNEVSSITAAKLGADPSGSDIVDFVLEEQDSSRYRCYEYNVRTDFKQNCEFRAQYLQKMIDLTGVNAQYFSCNDVFRNDKDNFVTALNQALQFVKILEAKDPNLIARINCSENTNQAKKTYLPLEIAEAIFFSETQGVSGKFGPITEKDFDECILRLMKEKNVGYTSLRCPLPPGQVKPAYLRNRDTRLLSTGGPQNRDLLRSKVIRRTLRKFTGSYRGFVEDYLDQIVQPGENYVGCIRRIQQELNGGIK